MEGQQTNPEDGTRIIALAEAWRATLHPSDANGLQDVTELLDAFERHQTFAKMLAREFPETTPGAYELCDEDLMILGGMRRTFPSKSDALWAEAYRTETA